MGTQERTASVPDFVPTVAEARSGGNSTAVLLGEGFLTEIVPSRVCIWLTALLIVLLLAHGLALLLEFGLGYSYAYGFVPLFNFGMEGNIPTLFSTGLLFLNGVLLLSLSKMSRRDRREKHTWLILSCALLFLAVDESVMIHERLIDPVKSLLDVGGVLYFAWVIPYAAIALLIGAICAPVIMRLDPRFIFLFMAAGIIYLGGAIGMEMLSGSYYESIESAIDLTYRLYQTAEETLEFAGLIVFMYTLLELIGCKGPHVTLGAHFSAGMPSSRHISVDSLTTDAASR